MNSFGYLGVLAAFVSGAVAVATSVTIAPAAPLPVHPVVDAQTGYLLGGSRSGKWLTDRQTAAALQGGETYRVYGNGTRSGETTGSKTRTGEAPCDETHWVKLQKNFNGVLAVGADWSVIPRNTRPQNLQQKFYRDEVARILKSKGIKKPKVVVSQLWRVDLDGDKTDEVLLSATNYGGEKAGPMQISSNARAGEYSLVLLRKVINGKAKTLMLAQEVYPQAKTFSAPNVHRLLGAYDLNGDGKMEVVLNSRYYEGDWVSVVEVKGDKPREVLSSGCGA